MFDGEYWWKTNIFMHKTNIIGTDSERSLNFTLKTCITCIIWCKNLEKKIYEKKFIGKFWKIRKSWKNFFNFLEISNKQYKYMKYYVVKIWRIFMRQFSFNRRWKSEFTKNGRKKNKTSFSSFSSSSVKMATDLKIISFDHKLNALFIDI